MHFRSLQLGVFSLLIIVACSPEKSSVNENSQATISSKDYDSILAKRTGADEYGMRQYVMAFLKAGPNRDQDSATIERIQRAHLDNINKMAKEGKLVVAGPFMDNGDIRGIYIFNVATVEEAQQLTNSDPAIKTGRLVMELHPWYGSAALMLTDSLHTRLAKKKI